MTAFEGRNSPFGIKGQLLEVFGVLPADGGLPAAMPGSSEPQQSARRGHWRERDLQRALDVAKRAGLTGYRVEIAPDGTIVLVIGEPPARRCRNCRKGRQRKPRH